MPRVFAVACLVIALSASCRANGPARGRGRRASALPSAARRRWCTCRPRWRRSSASTGTRVSTSSCRTFQGGAKALQALVGGSADVVSGYYDHTIQMAAEQRELVAFVTMLRYPGPRARDVAAGGRRGDDDRRAEGQDRRRDDSGVVVAHVSDVSADAASGSAGVGQRHRHRRRRHRHRRDRARQGRLPAGWRTRRSRWSRDEIPAIRVLADLRDERGTMEAFGTHTYPERGSVLERRLAARQSRHRGAAGARDRQDA